MEATQVQSSSSVFSIRKLIGPLLLILLCPPCAMIMWYMNVVLDGSVVRLGQMFWEKGVFSAIYEIWSPYFFGSGVAWKMIACYGLFELLLMKILPGKTAFGPITPMGNVPVYKANGPSAFFVTLGVYCLGSFGFGLFSPTIIYDHLGSLLGALNIFSLCFCLVLYFKGRFAPSSTDAGRNGNFLFDFYWGTELYPRFFGWDVKQFTNCRFGMMGWALILISYAAKQHQLYGISDSMLVALALQLFYITKFFFWEMGYMRSLDIMHDRAGFYICWGCLVWIPSVYTSPTMYLVNHPNHLGFVLAFAILAAGSLSIGINFIADRQRQRVRATNGNCTVWGKTPKLTLANYVTEKGEAKQSLLLAFGWWGVARHFHYVPEILGAFFWTLPALFGSFIPYFYVIFLTILLTDRAFRDDKRCAAKYGKDWDAHCEKVRYKIIPYVI